MGILGPVGLKEGRHERVLLHQLPNRADTRTLRLRVPCFMQDGGNLPVPRPGPRLAQAFVGDQRDARIADLQPVCVADDLHRPLDAVVSMHYRVDHDLTNGIPRDQRHVLAPVLSGRQVEPRQQVLQDLPDSARDGSQQRVAYLHALVTRFRIRHPFAAWDADVVHAHHGEEPAQSDPRRRAAGRRWWHQPAIWRCRVSE